MTWRVEHVDVRFGQIRALSDVSMSIEPGRIHAVVGGDGAGKSTLLRVLARLDVGQRGSFHLPPQSEIGFVPGQGGIFDGLTVDENMEFTAGAYRLTDWRRRSADLLASAGIGEFGSRLAGKLSGGQRRKLAASMALLSRPALLILDEVTTGVDPISRMELWRLIGAAAAGGAAVVIATSYLDEAERVHTVLLLHDGEVLAEGSPAGIAAGIPGAVLTGKGPGPNAWRHGRAWRRWDPDSPPNGQITLEDAAIVHELMRRANP